MVTLERMANVLVPKEAVAAKPPAFRARRLAEEWLMSEAELLEAREEIHSLCPEFPLLPEKSLWSVKDQRVIATWLALTGVDNPKISRQILPEFQSLLETKGDLKTTFQEWIINNYREQEWRPIAAEVQKVLADAKREMASLQPDYHLLEEVETTDSVALYLRDISCHPRMTREQEQTVGKLTAEWRGVISCRRPQEKALAGLWREVRQSGQEAINCFVNSNLRLVVFLAKKWPSRSSSLLERISNGNQGLRTAAEQFDWRLGWAFSTYATSWIKQAIYRGQISLELPCEASVLARHGGGLSLRQFDANSLTKEELEALVQKFKIRPVFMKQFVALAATQSLQRRLGEGDGDCLEDILPDEKTAVGSQVETDVWAENVLDKLAAIFFSQYRGRFANRDWQVYCRYYWAHWEGQKLTLAEIAEHFDLTRERVRQVLEDMKKIFRNRQVEILAEFEGNKLEG